MLSIIEFACCLLFLVRAGMLPVALLGSWNGYNQRDSSRKTCERHVGLSEHAIRLTTEKVNTAL